MCAKEATPSPLPARRPLTLPQPRRPVLDPGPPVTLRSFLERASPAAPSDLGSWHGPTVGPNNELSHVPKDVIFFKAFTV